MEDDGKLQKIGLLYLKSRGDFSLLVPSSCWRSQQHTYLDKASGNIVVAFQCLQSSLALSLLQGAGLCIGQVLCVSGHRVEYRQWACTKQIGPLLAFLCSGIVPLVLGLIQVVLLVACLNTVSAYYILGRHARGVLKTYAGVGWTVALCVSFFFCTSANIPVQISLQKAYR